MHVHVRNASATVVAKASSGRLLGSAKAPRHGVSKSSLSASLREGNLRHPAGGLLDGGLFAAIQRPAPSWVGGWLNAQIDPRRTRGGDMPRGRTSWVWSGVAVASYQGLATWATAQDPQWVGRPRH